jgi:hypothetical protein
MEAVKEITVWEDSAFQCNHTYLLDGDKMLAYIKANDTVPFYFKSPITISRSRRKFEKLKINPFKDVPKKAVVETPSYIKKVAGSKPGVTYEVNTNDNTCSCPGFTFRGKCKHTEDAV